MSMTVEEALERHKEDCRRCKDKACELNIQCLQKKDIEVYEEIQQYRAIGTISELRENKNFLEFLYNHIQPNEMEQYLSMYHTSEEKGEYLHE